MYIHLHRLAVKKSWILFAQVAQLPQLKNLYFGWRDNFINCREFAWYLDWLVKSGDYMYLWPCQVLASQQKFQCRKDRCSSVEHACHCWKWPSWISSLLKEIMNCESCYSVSRSKSTDWQWRHSVHVCWVTACR